MKKGRYETTYAIWYLLLKDTNANHNLKHHYLKLKLPFLNEHESDPCLQHFLKACEGVVSPCPEPFFCSWFHRHLILKKPWAYMGPVSEQPIPCDHLNAFTWASAMAPPPLGPHCTPAAPGSVENCWEPEVVLRIYSLAQLTRLPTISHEAHTFPFIFPAVVTQE